MGLDTVELLLTVEESFGIRVPDEEAAQAATVGDLHRLVLARVGPDRRGRCLSALAFGRVRGALAEVAGVARRDVRPGARLADLLPRATRPQHWAALSRRLDLKLPALVRRHRLDDAFMAVTLLALLAGVGVLLAPLPWLARLTALCALVVSPWAFERLTRRFVSEPPPQARTVGALVGEVVRLNHAALARDAGGASEREVWETLRAILINEYGIPPTRITPDARFVEDLGLD